MRRASLAALLAGAAVLFAGCNPAALSYFLSPEQPLPAKLKHLASAESKVEPRVVILVHSAGEVTLDFIHAEREIADLLAKNLKEMAKTQEEKIAVLPTRRVQEYKNSHPDWRSKELAMIGKDLGADHVVYVEINSLSLYENLSNSMLFRGRANMTLQVVDVKNPDDSPRQEIFATTFPSDKRGPVDVGIDLQPPQFRGMFLQHVAQQMSMYLSNYPRSYNRLMEPVL